MGDNLGPDDDNKVDSFDDLFEPFELDSPPPAGAAPPPETPEVHMVACPSCGTQNPENNRHCESCGARIAQGPLPVAPQPMLRTTPGARALGILAAVILIVAVLALIVNFLTDSSDDEPTTGSNGTVVDTSPTTVVLAVDELTPTSVTASSQLPGFEPEALIDDNPDNSWNDASLRGEGAELTFFFAAPVQISQIVIQNVEDNDRFLRNYRIEGLEITLDDIAVPIIRTLEDTTAPQSLDIGSLETNVVTMRVTSVYEASPVGIRAPFEELALQEVQFFGRLNTG